MINKDILTNFVNEKLTQGIHTITVRQYTTIINDLLSFNKNKSLTEITSQDINDFLKVFQRKSTKRNILTVLDIFYTWLCKEKLIDNNPTKEIKIWHMKKLEKCLI